MSSLSNYINKSSIKKKINKPNGDSVTVSIQELKQLLDPRIEALLSQWFPRGKRMGSDFRIGDLSGEKGASLSVCLSGPKRGFWVDHATGEGGDFLSLWMEAEQITFKQVINVASQIVGREVDYKPGNGQDRSGPTYGEVFKELRGNDDWLAGKDGAAIKEMIDERIPEENKSHVPNTESLESNLKELSAAKLSPRCIVESLIFADVAAWYAAGGTGKTTIFLRMSIDLVLGRPVFGYENKSPGKVIFITAEDRREQCLARLGRLMNAMNLSDEEKQHVLKNILIWDVSGEQMKLISIVSENILLTKLADDIVDAYQEENIALMCFDPLTSFGASERRVNDNENALITAGRRISRGLNCCVSYIHHTGQESARAKMDDQYSGRGGSALSDGCRMVATINEWSKEDKLKPPPGCIIGENETLMHIKYGKMSYGKKPSRIWLKRSEDWKFEQFNEVNRSQEEMDNINADQLERWLISQIKQGMRYTQRQIQDSKLYSDFGMSLHEFRRSLVVLIASGRVINAPLPYELKHKRRTEYLHPVEIDTI